jgi:hypothetical protein
MFYVNIILKSFLIGTLLCACSTPSSCQQAITRKREKLQAIVQHHATIQLEPDIDWPGLQQVFSHDEAVRSVSATQLNACLTKMVRYSNHLLLVNKTSGCEALHNHALSLDGSDLEYFVRDKQRAFSYCDSLRHNLMLRHAHEVQPCMNLVNRLMQQYGRPRDGARL